MGLLSKISSYFVKKPPPVTGMAALTAKRISPMPPPEVKTKSKKAPGALTDVDDIMQYCLYGLVLIVGGCSIFSLISSSHYGSEVCNYVHVISTF